MRKSIFEIENRLDINKEYERLVLSLQESHALIYKSEFMSLYEFLNDYVFPKWQYRDTFVDLDDYLEHIGINIHSPIIIEEMFLNFLEFLLNIWKTAVNVINFNNVVVCSEIAFNIIEHNVPILLEKMNYTIKEESGKLLIIKRDSDVDSILDIVPVDISFLLLSYNDIRNDNIEAKNRILKSLDLYIEKDKRKYKSYDSSLYDSIQTIVNEMGVNHPVHEKYKDMSETELCSWYDKCFKMMIHLIRTEDIICMKNERKQLLQEE